MKEYNKYMLKKYGEAKFHIFEGWYSVPELEELLIEAKKLKVFFDSAQKKSIENVALEESPAERIEA